MVIDWGLAAALVIGVAVGCLVGVALAAAFASFAGDDDGDCGL